MKFNIRDANGTEYNVEEVEENMTKFDEEPLEPGTDNALSADEMASLKKLASIADKLYALIDVSEKDAENEESEDDEEEIEDVDEQIEEVIDTSKTKDSIKKSASAIETVKAKAKDAIETDDVSIAWANRYGGKK